MKQNVGTIDRVIRVVVGAIVIGTGVYTQTWWLAILGAVPVLTGAIGFCPAYLPFGVNTKKA